MKAIKCDIDSDSDEQKRSPGFSGKNRGVTPLVAAPGVTHHSDATALTTREAALYIISVMSLSDNFQKP